MDKIESSYYFSSEYTDDKGKEQKATVILEINYRSKSFSVKPYGSHNEAFLFTNTCHKYKMWQAVLASIDDAIRFATIELNLEKPDKTVKQAK